jgi:hypothetical protein
MHGRPCRNPYRRLEPFTENDHALFFGREEELAQFLHMLDRYNVVTLVGEANVGKTSLLRAGAVPRLEAQGNDIFYSPHLDAPLLCFSANKGPADLMPPLTAELDMSRLTPRIREQPAPIVLLLDHGEELFTRASYPALGRFVRELNGLLADPALYFKWVLAMRASYAYRLLDLTSDLPTLYDCYNTLRLACLRREPARLALTCPAEQTRYPLAPELACACLDDLGQVYDPPDVEILGYELFERAQYLNRPMTLSDYRSAGCAYTIIDQFCAALVDN